MCRLGNHLVLFPVWCPLWGISRLNTRALIRFLVRCRRIQALPAGRFHVRLAFPSRSSLPTCVRLG